MRKERRLFSFYIFCHLFEKIEATAKDADVSISCVINNIIDRWYNASDREEES